MWDLAKFVTDPLWCMALKTVTKRNNILPQMNPFKVKLNLLN